jgi:hypothetical protein
MRAGPFDVLMCCAVDMCGLALAHGTRLSGPRQTASLRIARPPTPDPHIAHASTSIAQKHTLIRRVCYSWQSFLAHRVTRDPPSTFAETRLQSHPLDPHSTLTRPSLTTLVRPLYPLLQLKHTHFARASPASGASRRFLIRVTLSGASRRSSPPPTPRSRSRPRASAAPKRPAARWRTPRSASTAPRRTRRR